MSAETRTCIGSGVLVRSLDGSVNTGVGEIHVERSIGIMVIDDFNSPFSQKVLKMSKNNCMISFSRKCNNAKVMSSTCWFQNDML